MAFAQRLEMRQGQGLVMTPQLQQAIKLLQMSNLELAAFVEQELERNPVLEREENEPADALLEAAPAADAPETSLSLSEDAPPADAAAAVDTDYDNLYTDDCVSDRADLEPGQTDWSSAKGGGRFDEDDAQSLEATLSEDVSLHDHLAAQLPHAFPLPAERMIAAYLIDMIDEAGYLSGDAADAAQVLGADLAEVESVLKRIHRLDPTGVGARTLAECLAAQLIELDRYDPAMQAVIANLDLLAKRDMAQLMRIAGVDQEDLQDIIREIRALNPKPGLRFGATPVTPAVPDVFVRNNGRGGFVIELNTGTLPRVLVNQRYFATVNSKAKGKDDKAYLTECMNTANWLVKSLDQRARTILKVATEIVRQQDAFFVYGVQHLRPLNLKTIADAIGMHESTVSRVTSNKYMASPRGLLELKYFFTAAIASAEGGEAHSAEAVRHQIKELIDREAANDILSDDRIVEILRKTGVDIARRTVAKYRESLRIPSSVERRRLKSAPSGFASIPSPAPAVRAAVSAASGPAE
jgi:RNA polymerase sigma-54 factor